MPSPQTTVEILRLLDRLVEADAAHAAEIADLQRLVDALRQRAEETTLALSRIEGALDEFRAALASHPERMAEQIPALARRLRDAVGVVIETPSGDRPITARFERVDAAPPAPPPPPVATSPPLPPPKAPPPLDPADTDRTIGMAVRWGWEHRRVIATAAVFAAGSLLALAEVRRLECGGPWSPRRVDAGTPLGLRLVAGPLLADADKPKDGGGPPPAPPPPPKKKRPAPRPHPSDRTSPDPIRLPSQTDSLSCSGMRAFFEPARCLYEPTPIEPVPPIRDELVGMDILRPPR